MKTNKTKKLKSERLFIIRAYCTSCNKLLMSSIPLYRKELMNSWDKAVFDAPGIECKECGNKIPNFKIRLMIYNQATGVEYKPEQIMPKPINPVKGVKDILGIE